MTIHVMYIPPAPEYLDGMSFLVDFAKSDTTDLDLNGVPIHRDEITI